MCVCLHYRCIYNHLCTQSCFGDQLPFSDEKTCPQNLKLQVLRSRSKFKGILNLGYIWVRFRLVFWCKTLLDYMSACASEYSVPTSLHVKRKKQVRIRRDVKDYYHLLLNVSVSSNLCLLSPFPSSSTASEPPINYGCLLEKGNIQHSK